MLAQAPPVVTMSYHQRQEELTAALEALRKHEAQEARTVIALAIAGAARDSVILASLGALSINREASAIAEALAPDEAWATDEPVPDLSVLWATSDAKHGNTGGRYGAWIKRHPDLMDRAVMEVAGRAPLRYAHPLTIERVLNERAA